MAAQIKRHVVWKRPECPSARISELLFGLIKSDSRTVPKDRATLMHSFSD